MKTIILNLTKLLMTLLIILLLNGCNVNPEFDTVITDYSTSEDGNGGSPKRIEFLFEKFLQRAVDIPGSKFCVIVPGSDYGSVKVYHICTIPDDFSAWGSSNNAKKQVDSFKIAMKDKLKAISAEGGSALFESAMIAYEMLEASPKEYVKHIIILSDLREVNDAFDFNREVPKDEKKFFDVMREKNLIPKNNSDTKITVFGIHNKYIDSELQAKIRERWEKYFQLTGANYEINPPLEIN